MVAPIHCAQVNLDEVLENFHGSTLAFPLKYLGLLKDRRRRPEGGWGVNGSQ
jgi:hypothetical protein